jgi:hypothetical protein
LSAAVAFSFSLIDILRLGECGFEDIRESFDKNRLLSFLSGHVFHFMSPELQTTPPSVPWPGCAPLDYIFRNCFPPTEPIINGGAARRISSGLKPMLWEMPSILGNVDDLQQNSLGESCKLLSFAKVTSSFALGYLCFWDTPKECLPVRGGA